MKIPDELSAQSPHVVHVSLDRLRRQLRGRQVCEKWAEQSQQLLPRRQVLFQSHPRLRPTIEIAAVVFHAMTDCGGVFYLGSSCFPDLPFHAATPHNSKSLPPLP